VAKYSTSSGLFLSVPLCSTEKMEQAEQVVTEAIDFLIFASISTETS
jgi:hypothetical protein